MKFNQSLTAAITAAALVAGAGFAYAQTSTTDTTNMPGSSTAQGTLGQTPATNSGTTMQNQTSPGMTTMDNSARSTSMDTTLEPRADRN